MKIDAAMAVLYQALLPGEVDPAAFGNPPDFATSPQAALADIAAQVDVDTRQGRYLANLAYVLGLRIDGENIDAVTPELNALGAKILAPFRGVDGPALEPNLATGLRRVLGSPMITQDVVDDLDTAFGGSLESSRNASDQWEFHGPAAETATMLIELAALDIHCQCEDGLVTVDGAQVPVLKCVFEVCTNAPYDLCMRGVDPRNWPTYSPLFFQSVEVLSGSPSPGNWEGVIQESVGALLTGTPLITNLLVSYHEQAKMAVTAYDIAPDSSILKADDGTIDVDYGYFSVTDEGLHRRVSVVKIVHIRGKEDVPTNWMCPLVLQQQAMIGWWL
jgi:hypothetical protein